MAEAGGRERVASAPADRGAASFLSELGRRRVFRVLLGYGLASFAVLQVVEPIMHAIFLPGWVLTATVVSLGLGFPVAVALAWAFDLTPGGIERTPPSSPGAGLAGSRLWLLLSGLGLLAAAPGLAWYLVWREGSPQARLGISLAGGALALALTALWWRWRREPGAARPASLAAPAAAPPSIAVLPFADLSATQDQGYFCDGIADELLQALSSVAGLRVAARSSSFQFKGRGVDGREVGRALGVATLLEGAVRKVGNRVRVSAQLVGAGDGYQLWSESFDRSLEDIFAIQEEIAQAVVRGLRLKLSAPGQGPLTRTGTRNPQAYEMVLRGRQFLMTLSENGYRFARQMFKGAIELDPGYAQAHAGLADIGYFMLTWHLDDANAEAFRAESLAASEEALRLDPDLAEAHVSRANLLSVMKRDREAEQDFLRALALNPALPHAHYFYARHLFSSGRHDEAARQFEETGRLDPDDYASWGLLVTCHNARRDKPAAAAAAVRALEAGRRRLRLNPDDVRAIYMMGNVEISFGDRSRGLDLLARALALQPDDFGTVYNVACGYANAGELERSLDALERTIGQGRGSRQWMENDSDLDPLRPLPRFQALLGRLKS